MNQLKMWFVASWALKKYLLQKADDKLTPEAAIRYVGDSISNPEYREVTTANQQLCLIALCTVESDNECHEDTR